MPNFSQTFHTDEGIFTLLFTPIASLRVNKYFVVSQKGAETVAAFDMKQNQQGEWKVIAPAPECIIQAEATLAALLDAHQLQQQV